MQHLRSALSAVLIFWSSLTISADFVPGQSATITDQPHSVLDRAAAIMYVSTDCRLLAMVTGPREVMTEAIRKVSQDELKTMQVSVIDANTLAKCSSSQAFLPVPLKMDDAIPGGQQKWCDPNAMNNTVAKTKRRNATWCLISGDAVRYTIVLDSDARPLLILTGDGVKKTVPVSISAGNLARSTSTGDQPCSPVTPSPCPNAQIPTGYPTIVEVGSPPRKKCLCIAQ